MLGGLARWITWLPLPTGARSALDAWAIYLDDETTLWSLPLLGEYLAEIEARRRPLAAKKRNRPTGGWFWAAVAISLLVSLTPWAQFLLYPFKLFTTWVHESGHALMTVLVGGRVTSITIAAGYERPHAERRSGGSGRARPRGVGRVSRRGSRRLPADRVDTRREMGAGHSAEPRRTHAPHARPVDAQSLWRCGRARVECGADHARDERAWPTLCGFS